MRILYLGTGDIGLPTFRWLLDQPGHTVLGAVTQPDKPAGRKQELLASPIKLLALERGVPVFQPKRLRAPESLAPLLALAPELIVVMAYGQILPGELLRLPPRGLPESPRLAAARGIAAPRRSTRPSRRATARAASPSCTWTKGSIPARCCSPAACRSGAAKPRARCTIASPCSAPEALAEALALLARAAKRPSSRRTKRSPPTRPSSRASTARSIGAPPRARSTAKSAR